MSIKALFFVTVLLATFQLSLAQRNFDQSNHIGVAGGITFSDLLTDNFNTEQGTGFIVSFNTRGAFYNNFDLIYGLNFLQTKVGISASNATDPTILFTEQFVDYAISSAQIKILLSYNIIAKHLSVEAGPLLNVNGKMNIDDERFENFIINGFDQLRAGDIQNISKINAHLTGGITAGLTNIRLSAQYQYGLTNTLNALNDLENVNSENIDFKGNSATIIFTLQFYF